MTVPVDLDGARKVVKLVDALEDSDDVQDVYTNVDIPDDVAATLDEVSNSGPHVEAEVTANKATFRRFQDAMNTCDAQFISKMIDEIVEPDARSGRHCRVTRQGRRSSSKCGRCSFGPSPICSSRSRI